MANIDANRSLQRQEIVAEALGTSVPTLRRAMQCGQIPFGIAVLSDTGDKYRYLFFPEKVREYLGVSLDES